MCIRDRDLIAPVDQKWTAAAVSAAESFVCVDFVFLTQVGIHLYSTVLFNPCWERSSYRVKSSRCFCAGGIAFGDSWIVKRPRRHRALHCMKMGDSCFPEHARLLPDIQCIASTTYFCRLPVFLT